MQGFAQEESLKDVLSSMIRSLVKQPERISIQELSGENSSIFDVELTGLESADAGRVMGKGGETASALRRILTSASGVRQRQCQVNFKQVGSVSQRPSESLGVSKTAGASL